ncbi:B3 DNA binding domain [Macleaya cordata]|uniref:B3 DNA binding domain n=1 Tax=Macleaya cordata TaxID=56857 RepID=A0A200PVN0_MACCD|nr:B3 DNA binding domain [Macleaya cordata]
MQSFLLENVEEGTTDSFRGSGVIRIMYSRDQGNFNFQISDLPRNFVRKFEKELSDVAIVMVPCGTIWRVELRKAKGEIWFEKGWQEFMDYYSIGIGHFLIFRYDGNSHFHVIIFDMSACEIEYPCHTKDLEESNHERICQTPATEESDSVEMLDVRFPCLTCGSRKKVIDKFESQQTTNTMYLKPMTRLPFSRHHIAAKTIAPTSDADLGSYNKNKPKVRFLVKGNELDPIEHNRCEKFGFIFKDEPEVVTIDSDSENDDEPTMTTLHKSSSSRARDNYYSTKKKIDTRISLSPSSQYLDVDLNKGKLKRPKTDEVEANRVNRRTEPGCHDSALQEEASADVGITRRSNSVEAVIADLKERAIEAARAFKSENPFCVIIMRPTYLYNGSFVHIPRDFAKAYLIKKNRNAILRVPHGRTWHVQCDIGKYYTRLGSGWKKFVSDNQLNECDVCVFELVDRNNSEMNVSVFRVF